MEKGLTRKIDVHNPGFSWAKLIAQNLGIQEKEAQRRIDGNNSMPVDGEIYSTRFRANAQLLADASPHPIGPRGRRPSLVSARKIFDLSHYTTWQTQVFGRRLKKEFGGFRRFLFRYLGLTASNPEGNAPKGTRFSEDDVRYGIYIPRKIDTPTAQAIGIVYGNGTFGNGANLALNSSLENESFYKDSVRQIFEDAFNFFPDQEVKYPENRNPLYSKKKITSIRINYGSKAVKTYFLNHLGFPSNRNERKRKGVSDVIKNMNDRFQDEFLKYFLASTAAFAQNDGLVRIADASQPILEDIRVMINKRITSGSANIRSVNNSFILTISSMATMELYNLGYLNANPKVRERARKYFDEKSQRPQEGLLSAEVIVDFSTRK